MPDEPNKLAAIEEEECWELLRSVPVGRLATLLTISIVKVFVRPVAVVGMRRPSMATRSGVRD